MIKDHWEWFFENHQYIYNVVLRCLIGTKNKSFAMRLRTWPHRTIIQTVFRVDANDYGNGFGCVSSLWHCYTQIAPFALYTHTSYFSNIIFVALYLPMYSRSFSATSWLGVARWINESNAWMYWHGCNYFSSSQPSGGRVLSGILISFLQAEDMVV